MPYTENYSNKIERLRQDLEQAAYACINRQEAVCPNEIKNRSICIDADIGDVVKALI